MTKRTNIKIKGQTMIYKTLPWKLQIKQDYKCTCPAKIRGERRFSGRVSSSYSTCDTRPVTVVAKPAINRELGKDGL